MIRTLLALLPLLTLSCATVRNLPQMATLPALDEPALGWARPGSADSTVTEGTLTGQWGCRMDYEVHTPLGPSSEVLVVLAHGFLRSLQTMRGWAELWASHGVRVVVMSLCNSSPVDGNHDRNAADLVSLAGLLHDGPVLYAGFSAGGLAALLAAAQDPRAVAWLGLDAVDSGELAASAAQTLRVPALYLAGESAACNAHNNILRSLPAHVTALRVVGAVHGHFENPYDTAVETVCGRVEPPESSDRIREAIRALATAWVLGRTGTSPEADLVLHDATEARFAWTGRVSAP